MRVRAFGAEPPDTLLSSMSVALTSIDVLVSDLTGQVIDVRRIDPTAGGARLFADAEPDAVAVREAPADMTHTPRAHSRYQRLAPRT
jgi:hypothetical protein